MTEAGAGGTNTGWLGWPRGLPSLGGARAYVAGVFYVALATVTLGVIAGTLWALAVDGLYNAPAASRWGFRTATTQDGVIVGGTTAAAEAAGLRQGDAIVAIGGTPVRAADSEFAIAARLREVTAPTLALRVKGKDAAREVRLAERTGVWWHADPMSGLPLWLYAVLTIGATPAPFLFAASLLLFLRRPRDPEAMLLATAFLLVNYTPDLLWWTDAIGVPRFALEHLGTVGWLLVFVGMAGFPDGRFVSPWARGAVIATLVIEGVVLAVRATNGGVVSDEVKTGVALASALTGLAAGVAVLLRYRALPVGPERQQIKWAVGGFAVSALTAVIVIGFDPAVFLLSGNPWLFATWQLASLVLPGAFALGLLISLLGYRLYDAEAALAKSLAYGALTIALIGVFAASGKLVEMVGERALGPRLGAISGVIAAAISAILIGPLHRRVTRWTERRFQRRLIRLREGLPETMEDLRETEALPAIGAAAAAAVVTAVRARRAAVIAGETVIGAHGIAPDEVAAWRDGWIAPDEPGLHCDAGDALFPLRVALAGGEGDESAPIGWLLIGARPDGSLPGRAERAALADVAAPIARAIQTVRRRDARERAHAQRIDTLEARLAAALTALEGAAKSA